MAFFALLENILSSHASKVVTAVASILAFTVLANVFQQTLLKRSNEPPVVFHWLPVIGSTVTYGIDPFKFFFKCQAKVCIRNLSNMIKNLNK